MAVIKMHPACFLTDLLFFITKFDLNTTIRLTSYIIIIFYKSFSCASSKPFVLEVVS